MAILRKLFASILSILVGLGILLFGGSPTVASLVATSAGEFALSVVQSERPRELVVKDVANHANRAKSYEDFSASVAIMWQTAGILNTFRPKATGYIHGLLLLMRAQRRFEDQVASSAAALGSVLLYGSSDTQQAAVKLYKTLGKKLIELGRCGQGSREARSVFDEASLDIGDKAVLWRAAAQADLAVAGS